VARKELDSKTGQKVVSRFLGFVVVEISFVEASNIFKKFSALV
jgi:hypothetical protein